VDGRLGDAHVDVALVSEQPEIEEHAHAHTRAARARAGQAGAVARLPQRPLVVLLLPLVGGGDIREAHEDAESRLARRGVGAIWVLVPEFTRTLGHDCRVHSAPVHHAEVGPLHYLPAPMTVRDGGLPSQRLEVEREGDFGYGAILMRLHSLDLRLEPIVSVCTH
jgi:hypothetical protein